MHTSTNRLLTLQPAKLLKGLLPAAAMSLALLSAAPAHAGNDSGLTRAEVREALKTWKAAGLMSTQTEVGDTPDVLQRREEFYALQTEVILGEYAAARAAEEAQALAQLQQQNANPAMLEPSADGEVLMTPNGNELVVVEIDD